MSFTDEWAARCAAGDFDGALALLEAVFHAPENQARKGRPSDYLRESAESEPTPASGFDAIVAGFRPRRSIDDRVALVLDRLGQADEAVWRRHRAQPFDAVRYKVGTYDRGSVVADSLHLGADGVPRNQGLVLNHEILFDSDSREDYSFTYELVHGRKFALRWQGEVLEGEALYFQLKLVVFARYLRELSRALVAAEAFAAVPKALPFRFLVGEDQGYGGREAKLNFPLLPPIDEATLADHPHRAAWLRVASGFGALSDDERYLSLLGLVDAAEHRYFARDADVARQGDELLEFLRDHPAHRARFAAFAHRHCARVAARLAGAEAPPEAGPEEELVRGSISTFAGILWPIAPDDAERLTREAYALPLPALGEELDEQLHEAGSVIETVWQVHGLEPEGRAEALRPAWDALAARVAAWGPVPRVLWREQEQDEPDDDAYVADVTGLVDAMPRTFGGWAHNFPFVNERLVRLGTRAAAAIPAVLRLVDAYATQYDAERTCAELGKVLVALGHDEVPAVIHGLANVQYRNHAFADFYPAWAERVPKRRIAELEAAAASDPASARTPAFWERWLHDSPAGTRLGLALLEGRADLLAAAESAAPEAGPLLAAVLGARAAALVQAKQWTAAEATLARLPERTDDQVATLRRVRCRLAADARIAGAPDADARIAELVRAYPDEPYPAFLATLAALDRDGPRAVVEPTRAALARIAAADPVYAKAAVVYTASERIGDISDEALYGVFRLAQDADADRRRGSLAEVDGDPVARALDAIGAGSPAQWSSAWRRFSSELALIERVRGAGDEAELLACLDGADAQGCLFLAGRLLKDPTPARVAALLDAYGRFVDDAPVRQALHGLLWPLEAHRDQLLQHPAWLRALPTFLVEVRGSSIEVCKECFTRLAALGRHDDVIAATAALPDPIRVGAYKSTIAAFHQRGEWSAAIALTRSIVDRLDPANPEYVLMASNLAVNQMLSGDHGAAEATFDALFAHDFSRFLDHEEQEDDFADEILGGSVDEPIVEAFRLYWAMAQYNRACLYALGGRPAPAVAALEEAVRYAPDHYDADKLRDEPDFADLAEDPAFEALLARLDGGEA